MHRIRDRLRCFRPFIFAGTVLLGVLSIVSTSARGDDPAAIGPAKELYAKNCFSCHGEGGRGDGPSGLFLKEKPADLASAKVRAMSDDEIFERITSGRPPMPGFAKRLSEEERREIVRYLRTLGR